MKHLVFLIFLVFQLNMFGQSDNFCGSTMQAHQHMEEINPEYKKHVEQWRKKIIPIIEARRTNKNPDCSNGPIVVPMAVHFDSGIVPAAQEACVITAVEDQIDELNAELAGMDADAGTINNFTSCFGANILGEACLEFCLATFDHPAGYGLVDGDFAITFGQVSFAIPAGNFTPVNSDWDEYMNIYVDALAGGLLGVSNGIPGQFNGDGVLVDHCVFGTGAISCPGVPLTGSAGCFPAYDEGETVAHEIGHYFGLYHIWGDNFHCNGSQDMIADTPDMDDNYSGYVACASHLACSDLPLSCGSEDMYMNFMSYAGDACMYMFTSDQSDVMNATAVAEGFGTTSIKCDVTIPVADFSPDGNITLCSDLCIAYIDLSTNTPTEWDWDFNVISGNLTLDSMTSVIQNPVVCVLTGTGGTISTTLIASNTGGSDTITKNQVITIQSAQTWYLDNDGDMFGDNNNSLVDCNQPSGYVLNNTDCDDNDANNYPGNAEICDGQDNDCDGLVDDNDPNAILNTWYQDMDGDMFGNELVPAMACDSPFGYVADDTDCDDNNADNYPGNTEICDGQDNDCDGLIDDQDGDLVANTYYFDNDMDNFGDPNNTIESCTIPSGYVIDNTDCDDNDAINYPGNTEVCDDSDNNCDGMIDEGVTTTYYKDNDMDGFGDNNNNIEACSLPSGYVTDNTDCDDSDGNNYPGNTEVCDGFDNNCDTQVDEGVTSTFYADTDSDGFGDNNNQTEACSAPSGYVIDNTDCDDSDSNNYPGNTEICGDNSDNDCDGLIDEDCNPVDCDGDSLIINTITMDSSHAQDYILSDATILTGENILFTAGLDMDLIGEFEVELGATFEAKIISCIVLMRIANQPLDEDFMNLSKLESLIQSKLLDDNEKIKLSIINLHNEKVFKTAITKEHFSKRVLNKFTQLKDGVYLISLQKESCELDFIKVFWMN